MTPNGAYMDATFALESNHKGPLSGKTFAVKDVFDIAGRVNSLGNPTWQSSHEPSKVTATVIVKLLEAGASLRGVTVTDEFMYSIKGDNKHYGAPINPVAPDSFCGGSSSGSASAVASGDVDFALGTDTGGSIRVPAAACGLFGFRPSWHQNEMKGVAPLAPSFDTVGILTSNFATLEVIGSLLYSGSRSIDFNDPVGSIDIVSNNVLSVNNLFRTPERFDLNRILSAFQRIQGFEAWKNYGPWLNKHSADLGTDIKQHFELAKKMAADIDAYKVAKQYQQQWHEVFNQLLNNHILVIPTTFGMPLKKSASLEEGELTRRNTQRLTSIAGLSGNPQITIPGILPGGLSFIGPYDSDLTLLRYAKTFSKNNLFSNLKQYP